MCIDKYLEVHHRSELVIVILPEGQQTLDKWEFNRVESIY